MTLRLYNTYFLYKVIGVYIVCLPVCLCFAFHYFVETAPYSFFLFLSYLGLHALPSHASVEACLTDWPNAQPQDWCSVG